MSNQLTIPAETVAAVNAVIDQYGSSLHGSELDEFGVHALILALSKSGPVAGLVDSLCDTVDLLKNSGREDDCTWQPGQSWIFREDKVNAKRMIVDARAALAPFAKGGA